MAETARESQLPTVDPVRERESGSPWPVPSTPAEAEECEELLGRKTKRVV